MTRSSTLTRAPISPALVAQLRAADAADTVARRVKHGSVAGIRHHARKREPFCVDCAAYVAHLLSTRVASWVCRECGRPMVSRARHHLCRVELTAAGVTREEGRGVCLACDTRRRRHAKQHTAVAA